MPNYPAAPPGLDETSLGTETLATAGTADHNTLHTTVNDEVNAIAEELGLDPAGTEATVVARLNANDAAVSLNTAKASNATHTGDVTGSAALTIAANAVTNSKAADMATARIKGRATTGSGDPEDLTGAQATALLDVFVGDSGSGGTKGSVPAPAAGDAGKHLLGDGTWATPAAGGASAVLDSAGLTLVLSTLWSIPASSDADFVHPEAQLWFTPRPIPVARTLSEIAIDIASTGAAGSLIRLGVYGLDSNGGPGALLLDAGTLDAAASTGIIALVGLSTVLSPPYVWDAYVIQGVAASRPSVNCIANSSHFNEMRAGTTIDNGTSVKSGLYQTGVTGALPANAAPTVTNRYAPKLGMRFSA